MSAETERHDIRGVGRILIELMEPTTFMDNPDTVTLQEPKRWNERQAILSFLEATATSTLKELKEHEFIPKRSTAFCLKPHVVMAQTLAKRIWGTVQ